MEEVKNVVANENFDWNAFENDLGVYDQDKAQIFKNRLLKTIHKSIKKRRVQNWKIQFSVWSYDEKVWSGRKNYQIERNII